MFEQGDLLMNNLTVVTPTFHSPHLADIFIRSFEKFKPKDLAIEYIVVENSDDSSYRDHVLSLAKNIVWIQNPGTTHIYAARKPGTENNEGSKANGLGVDKALKHVKSEYVFIAHCDTCVTSQNFFHSIISKAEEGNVLVGTSLDGGRINAVHISGLLIKSEIAKKVDIMPVYEDNKMIMDVGDSYTKYCRDNNLPYFCFPDTHGGGASIDNLEEKFRKFHVGRTIDDDGNVMFMHLGRGIEKTHNTYRKPNRPYLPDWYEFCSKILEDN